MTATLVILAGVALVGGISFQVLSLSRRRSQALQTVIASLDAQQESQAALDRAVQSYSTTVGRLLDKLPEEGEIGLRRTRPSRSAQFQGWITAKERFADFLAVSPVTKQWTVMEAKVLDPAAGSGTQLAVLSSVWNRWFAHYGESLQWVDVLPRPDETWLDEEETWVVESVKKPAVSTKARGFCTVTKHSVPYGKRASRNPQTGHR